MKLRFAVVVMLLFSVLVLAEARVAYAQWPAIDSGYGVTTNWHGQVVPFESVTAWAGTTDSSVKKVEFKWLDPAGNLPWGPVWVNELDGPYETPTVPDGVPPEIKDWAEKNPGITVWYAQDTQIPNALGDWGVQAVFHDSGKIKGKNSDIMSIRATSLNTVPEVPFGTIATLLSMFGALAIFAIRKKYTST